MPPDALNPDNATAPAGEKHARELVEAVPFRFLQLAAGASAGLPGGEAEALALINALLPEGAPKLTAEQVYIHLLEACNDNLISDRYLFVDESTLKNVAAGAAQGFAFMNSHRTGGFLKSAELPLGKAFCGKFSRSDGRARALVGIYMLRGTQPNGEDGPSTDDLNTQIAGGVITDCSVTLYGGEVRCDVCGNGLMETDDAGRWLCSHYPGTRMNMSPEQVAAQKARGVPDGCATYRLVGASCSEVSAVFDGACPGAGFRKMLSLAAGGTMDAATLLRVRQVYGAQLSRALLPETPEALAALAEKLEQQISGEESEPPAGRSLADHSAEVLAACSEYVGRVEAYAALRAKEARPPSVARRAEWETLAERLRTLLAATEPPAVFVLVDAPGAEVEDLTVPAAAADAAARSRRQKRLALRARASGLLAG